MKISRWIILTLLVHTIGAITVAITSMGIKHALSAGLLYSIFGIFYLLLEAPLILAGMFLVRIPEKTFIRHAVSVLGMITGMLLGWFMCFTEGGEKKHEYLVGFILAGFLGALFVTLEYYLSQRESMKETPSNLTKLKIENKAD